MQYRIARDGSEIGEYSVQEIRSGLVDDRFSPSDLGWREGMSDWQPLGVLFPQDKAQPVVQSQPPVLAAPPPMAMPGAVSSANAGLAIAALVLGIVSVLTCGLLGLGSLGAIICGHMALAKIRQSQGALRGRGMATTGLILGYGMLAIFAVSIMASLAVPTFTRIQERGNLIKSVNHARQLVLGCQQYVSEKGRLPAALEELVEAEILDADTYAQLTSDPQGLPAFEYLGAGQEAGAEGNLVVLTGVYETMDGKRVVGRLDGSVAVEIWPP